MDDQGTHGEAGKGVDGSENCQETVEETTARIESTWYLANEAAEKGGKILSHSLINASIVKIK